MAVEEEKVAPWVSQEQRAIEWKVRLLSGNLRPDEAEEFAQWLEDDACAAAMEKVHRLWSAVDQIADHPKMLRLREGEQSALRRRKQLINFMKAACGLFLLVLTGIVIQKTSSHQASVTFSTAIGEKAVRVLADQSSLTLNTNSVVNVDFTSSERRITLVRGQALFKVAKDANRPFVVLAGKQRIVATGTAFDVRVDARGTSVTMVEGHVTVNSGAPKTSGSENQVTTLQAGEQLVAPPDSELSIHSVSVNQVISWSRDELVFRNTPLADAIDEVNRYSKVQILIMDEELGRLRLNGVFRAGHPMEFVDAVSQVFSIGVDYRPGGEIRLYLPKR